MKKKTKKKQKKTAIGILYKLYPSEKSCMKYQGLLN